MTRERSSKVKVQNSKNFISELSWIYTYIKCIIPKSSKKRVRPLLCTTLVPHLWYMWYKHKCTTLLWYKFYKLQLFHFSTYMSVTSIRSLSLIRRPNRSFSGPQNDQYGWFCLGISINISANLFLSFIYQNTFIKQFFNILVLS